MKKSTKVFTGIFIAVVCIVVLSVVVRPYFTGSREEETTKKQTIVKAPKQVYEIGEDMEADGLIFNVSEAELFSDYEKIDFFYKERNFLQSQKEYVKAYIERYTDKDFFAGDIRFFRIKCLVTNTTNKEVDFYTNSMYPTSIVGGSVVSWDFMCYDGKGVSVNAKEKEVNLEGGRKPLYMGFPDETEPYAISPEESIEIEVVGEFCLLDIYPDYLEPKSDGQNSSYDLYLIRDNSTKRIHLNISGSFDNKNSTYFEARNILEMKSESWTNLEQKTWRDEFKEMSKKYNYSFSADGYPSDIEKRQLTEMEEPGQKFLELLNKRWTNGEIEAAFSLETVLTNYEIVDWKNLPSDFAGQGNLQKMMQRYHDIHNCQEEDLKVLILDLNYTSGEMGVLLSEEKEIVNYFYERSKIYVRNEDENQEETSHWETLQLFGTADDWIVTENSAHPENIGCVSMDNMELNANISIRMAYILPPQLYEEYSALYFTGGKYEVNFDAEDIPRTKIVL